MIFTKIRNRNKAREEFEKFISKSVEILAEDEMKMNIHKNKMLWYNPIFDSWKDKNGYKPSKHGLCSRFLFRNDMCYIMIFLI